MFALAFFALVASMVTLTWAFIADDVTLIFVSIGTSTLAGVFMFAGVLKREARKTDGDPLSGGSRNRLD